MKNKAFTLVELLVVIAIIAILAAILLPALSRVKTVTHVHITQAKISELVQAITSYENYYGRLPIGPDTSNAGNSSPTGDFTYGSTNNGVNIVYAPGNTIVLNNEEVISILNDTETLENGTDTVNKNHVRNPQRTKYLNINTINDNFSPGIGQDGIYRDFWGNPFIISLDTNADNNTIDTLYSSVVVSKGGLNGLKLTTIKDQQYYQYHGDVMVWSFGPDKKASFTDEANKGVNKDNILRWK